MLRFGICLIGDERKGVVQRDGITLNQDQGQADSIWDRPFALDPTAKGPVIDPEKFSRPDLR